MLPWRIAKAPSRFTLPKGLELKEPHTVTTWQPDKGRTKKQAKNPSQSPNFRKAPGPAGWPHHRGNQNSTMWPGAEPDLLVPPHGPLSHSGPLGHLSPRAGNSSLYSYPGGGGGPGGLGETHLSATLEGLVGKGKKAQAFL